MCEQISNGGSGEMMHGGMETTSNVGKGREPVDGIYARMKEGQMQRSGRRIGERVCEDRMADGPDQT